MTGPKRIVSDAPPPSGLDREGYLRWRLGGFGIAPPPHVRLDVDLPTMAPCNANKTCTTLVKIGWTDESGARHYGPVPFDERAAYTFAEACPTCTGGATKLQTALGGLDAVADAAQGIRDRWLADLNAAFTREPWQAQAVQTLAKMVANYPGHQSVVLWGPTRSGKSLLALRAIASACDEGLDCRVMAEGHWIASYNARFDQRPHYRAWSEAMRSAALTAQVLLVDDFGLRQKTTAGAVDAAQELLEARKNGVGRLIVTTNAIPSLWPSLRGERVAEWLRRGVVVEVVNRG